MEIAQRVRRMRPAVMGGRGPGMAFMVFLFGGNCFVGGCGCYEWDKRMMMKEDEDEDEDEDEEGGLWGNARWKGWSG